MSYVHPTARRNAIAATEGAAIDAGSGSGMDADRTGHTNGAKKIYSGSVPSENSGATGSLLCIIELPNPSFGTPSSGSATLNGTPLTGTIAISGTATYFRDVDRDGNLVAQGSCGASGADLNFSGGTALVATGTLTLSSYSVAAPA